ncbi:MAG: PAS domain S-box protein [archaeon]
MEIVGHCPQESPEKDRPDGHSPASICHVLQDGILDITCLIDTRGGIQYVSPSCKNILGYDPGALVGKSLFKIVHPDDLERVQGWVAEAATTRCPVSFEYRCKYAGGQYAWVEYVGNPILEGDRVMGIIANIRRKAQYQCPLEDSMDAISVTVGSKLAYVNEHCAKLLGFDDPSMLVGKDIVEFIAPEDREKVLTRTVGRQKGEEHPPRYEFKMQTRNGAKIDIETQVTVIDYRGERAVLAFMRDLSEHRRVEHELKRSEERFRKIFHSSPIPTMITSLEGPILDVNDAWAQMTGCSKEEAIGHSSIELGIASDPEERNHIVRELLEKGRLSNIELKRRTKSGEIRDVLNTLELLELDGEKYILNMQVDITERKQVEQTLRRNEERYRLMLENMANAVAVYEPVDKGTDFIFREFNAAAERTERIKREEVIGKSVLKAFPGVKEFGLFDVFQRVYKTGKPEYHPTSLYNDGRVTGWRENYVYKLRSGEVVAIYEDVTERKQAECELSKTQKLLSSLMDHTPTPICITSIDNRYRMVNRAWEQLMGLKREEVIGYSVDQILPDEVSKELAKFSQQVIEKGAHVSGEFVCDSPNGQRCLQMIRFPLRDEEGNIEAIGSVSLDITDRKRMEEDLQKMSRAVEQSPNSVIVMDTEGRIEYVNHKFTHLSGYSSKEALGMDALDLVQQEETAKKEMVEEVTSGGEWHGELCSKKKNGGVFWELASISAVKNQEGIITHHVRVGEDITERKRAEEQTRALARYPLETPSPVLRISKDGIILDANPASAALLVDWGCKVGGEAPAYWRGVVAEVFSSESARSIDLELGENTYLFTLVPVTYGGYVNLYGKDITDRVRLEDDLRIASQNSEEKYKTLVTTSPDAVIVADLEGKITDVSQQTVELHASESADELIGRSVYDFIAPEDQGKAMTALQRLTKEGIVKNLEYMMVRKGGTRFKGEMNIALIRDADGSPKSLMATVRDITERSRLQQMRDRFMSAVTHELRTPLVSIRGYTDYISDGMSGPVPGAVMENVEVVKRNADRLLNLTDDLLDIQRMQVGRLQLNLQTLQLAEVISGALKEIKPIIEQKKQSLNLKVPKTSLLVHGDPIRLNQVLVNLLSNAVKFTPEGGTITLRVNDGNESIDVQLSDTGIGIKEEDLARVFEPFAAIEKPTYTKGTGLGLSVTKALVETHSGKIWAESPGEGKGATFTFTLPKWKEVK